ncbi:hypothetical protein RM52_08150 [Microbacterium hominis]|uniref:Uncharacterized protein n=1 Tax=Microbacterium hominis TaxID=162426 RepID=A0A0B4CA49_9MICO|nr:hypothetical protein RM52_08150 [Microbacterium hominis]
MVSGGESVLDGIAAHAANDSTYRAAAIKLTETWTSRIAEGATIKGLDISADDRLNSQRDTQSGDIAKLHAELVTGNLPKTELFSPGAGKASLRSALAARSSTDAFGSNVNGDNPNSFDVRGSAGIGFWTDMQLENAGTDCEPSGCEQTDRYTSSVTIDPGAVTTKVSATNSYFPDSGNFGKKYFELWAFMRNPTAATSPTEPRQLTPRAQLLATTLATTERDTGMNERPIRRDSPPFAELPASIEGSPELLATFHTGAFSLSGFVGSPLGVTATLRTVFTVPVGSTVEYAFAAHNRPAAGIDVWARPADEQDDEDSRIYASLIRGGGGTTGPTHSSLFTLWFPVEPASLASDLTIEISGIPGIERNHTLTISREALRSASERADMRFSRL